MIIHQYNTYYIIYHSLSITACCKGVKLVGVVFIESE